MKSERDIRRFGDLGFGDASAKYTGVWLSVRIGILDEEATAWARGRILERMDVDMIILIGL